MTYYYKILFLSFIIPFIFSFHNKINLWDIAAGKIIIEEAGGKVNEIDYSRKKIDVRAANPNIYDKMLNKLDNF